MTYPSEEDIIPPRRINNRNIMMTERVWRHLYDLDLRASKASHTRLVTLAALGSVYCVGAMLLFEYLDGHVEQPPERLQTTLSAPINRALDIPGVQPVRPTKAGAQPALPNAVRKDPIDAPVTVVPMRRPEHLVSQQGVVPKQFHSTTASASIAIPGPKPCGVACEMRTPRRMENDFKGDFPPQPRLRAEAAAIARGTKTADNSIIDASANLLGQIAALPFATIEVGWAVLSVSPQAD